MGAMGLLVDGPIRHLRSLLIRNLKCIEFEYERNGDLRKQDLSASKMHLSSIIPVACAVQI
jgi:hypothetical protein